MDCPLNKVMDISVTTQRPTFQTDRADGRFVSTAGFLHAHLKRMQPRLAFDPAMSPDEFPAWQEVVRKKLWELMRVPDVPPQPEPKHLWTEQREGHQLQKWEAYPEPLSVVPFLVLVPDGVSQQSPAPAVVCVPGSANSKEALAGEPELPDMPPPQPHWVKNRMALLYTQKGMVTVAVDNPGVREVGDAIRPERHEISVNGLWAGRPYECISVTQKLSILDWLKQQPYVDADRIATSGHSLGAKAALIMGVLDPTIRAVVWNDFCSDWRRRAVAENLQRISIHQYIPDFHVWFDYTDLLASLAPRGLAITEGGRTQDLDQIREAYRLLGAEGEMEVAYYPKYATPDKRRYDDVELPDGVTPEEYFLYANVDVPAHSFKPDVAVPWLARQLGM